MRRGKDERRALPLRPDHAERFRDQILEDGVLLFPVKDRHSYTGKLRRQETTNPGIPASTKR
jgi:hypothetical protein